MCFYVSNRRRRVCGVRLRCSRGGESEGRDKWRAGTLEHGLTHLGGAPFFLFMQRLSANGGVTLPDSPANVLLARENPAGRRASRTTGEINRAVTTQLPAAATTAARQPRQMHSTPTSSVQYGRGWVFLVGIYNEQ